MKLSSSFTMSLMPEPRIIITSGEPAGIGPDIIASIDPASFDAKLTVIGDRDMLQSRAAALGSKIKFTEYADAPIPGNAIAIIDQPLGQPSIPGQLDCANAKYVLTLLEYACKACLDHQFDAMVTAPVQKEIINRAGISFSGHTEYLADICNVFKPVMLLVAEQLRVALVTTHLPLRQVADSINARVISEVVEILDRDLRIRFGIQHPHIKVCGLNPHAGENGYLGREEIEIIIPALAALEAAGINLSGPYSADTLFTAHMLADADAVLAMYHDQGLPVLKHVGFHNAVNTTLGLPIIRTSVDHGTALDLAGTTQARPESLFAAIDSAIFQAHNKQQHAPGA
jgi:4-hydroxythreonine-4-phosphate dehydrogenase